jgi:hypothetical protein
MEFSLRQPLDAPSISADHKKGTRLSQGRMTVRDFSPKMEQSDWRRVPSFAKNSTLNLQLFGLRSL